MTGGLFLFGAGLLLLVIAFHRSWANVWNVLVKPPSAPTSGSGSNTVK